MQVICERYKKEMDCTFYGYPSDPGNDEAQNGEWLCRECLPLRSKELDKAIAQMRQYLGKDGG